MKKPLAVGDKIKFVIAGWQEPRLGIIENIDGPNWISVSLKGIIYKIHPRQVVSRIVKKQKHVIWVNVYKDHEGVSAWTTKEYADKAARECRIGGKAWRYVKAKGQS